jgi:hypothetical protein
MRIIPRIEAYKKAASYPENPIISPLNRFRFFPTDETVFFRAHALHKADYFGEIPQSESMHVSGTLARGNCLFTH